MAPVMIRMRSVALIAGLLSVALIALSTSYQSDKNRQFKNFPVHAPESSTLHEQPVPQLEQPPFLPTVNHYDPAELSPYCSQPKQSHVCIEHIASLHETAPTFPQHLHNGTCFETNRFLFHAYWDKVYFPDPILLFVTSFLATQNRCAELMLWTASPAPFTAKDLVQSVGKHVRGNLDLQGIQDRIHVEALDLALLFSDSIFSHRIATWDLNTTLIPPTARSDLVRFVVLWKHGGVYLDLDSVFLRDFYPLQNQEYAYPWSHLKDFNTAVLALHKNSSLSNDLLLHLFRVSKSLGGMARAAHPRTISKTIFREKWPLLQFPVIMFDAYWMFADGQTDRNDWWLPHYEGKKPKSFEFFNKGQYDGKSPIHILFPASFSYHTHNSVKDGIANGSWGDQFVEEFRTRCYEMFQRVL